MKTVRMKIEPNTPSTKRMGRVNTTRLTPPLKRKLQCTQQKTT